MFYKFICLSFLLIVLGCSASVKHMAVDTNDDGTGIRYYQCSPYLLVYSDSKGGLVWQILFLPDQTKKMMLKPKVWGGRSEMTLYFKNGIVAGSTEVGDTTELPKAVIAAVQSVVPFIAKGAGIRAGAPPKAEAPSVPPPYLYKIVVVGKDDGKDDGSTSVQFIGGPADARIVVTIKEANP